MSTDTHTDTDTGTTAVAEAAVATRPSASPLVASIYYNRPCRKQEGGQPIVDEAVVDLGNAGPVVLFWHCSGFTRRSEGDYLIAQPIINREVSKADSSLRAEMRIDMPSTHRPLLRRRAYTNTLPQGQSFFGVHSNQAAVTDANDTVHMVALDVSDIGVPPLIRFSRWGQALDYVHYFSEQLFDSDGGPLLVSVATTAYSRKEGQMLGACLWIDDQPKAIIRLFANAALQHMGLVGVDRVIELPAGRHSMRLEPIPGTTIDANDTWSVLVMEMRAPSRAVNLLENATPAAQKGGGEIASVGYESTGGTHLVCLWMSAYTATANRVLDTQILVDDNPVGKLQVHANQAQTHMLLNGGDIAAGSIPKGSRTIKVVAGKDTITDENDRVSLSVIEVFR